MPKLQIALKTALVLVHYLHHKVNASRKCENGLMINQGKWQHFIKIKTIKIQDSYLKLLLRDQLYLWQLLKSVMTFIFNLQTNHESNFLPLFVFNAIFLTTEKKDMTTSLYKLWTQQHNFNLIDWLIFSVCYLYWKHVCSKLFHLYEAHMREGKQWSCECPSIIITGNIKILQIRNW